MAIKTKKLTEVSVLDQATEQTNVLVEHDGKTMRLPLGGLGIAQLLERIEALENRENSAPAPSLITFTVDGKQYQAEAGMTWGQFLESEYNRTVVCEECGASHKSFYEHGGSLAHAFPAGSTCYECNPGILGEMAYMSPDGMSGVSLTEPIDPSYEYMT